MKIKISLITAVIIILLFVVLDYERSVKIENHLSQKNEYSETLYNALHNKFEEKSRILFESLINNSKVVDIYKKLNDVEYRQEDKRGILRSELYGYLVDDYNNFKYTKLRQLHFHLPTNESFLRFHKPDEFGDDLSRFRETVAYVNKYHNSIGGFEVGKLVSGYRFVYPIKDNENVHLGSVEVSFDISAFVTEIMQQFNSIGNFHIISRIVDEKTFVDKKDMYYEKSPISGHYMEKGVIKEIERFTKKSFKQMHCSSAVVEEISKNISSNKTFSVYDSNHSRIITVLPIRNEITRNVVAYFTVKSDAIYIANKNRNFIFVFFLICAFVLLVASLVYREFSVQEKTSKILSNKNRELEVANKAKDDFLASMSHELRTPLTSIIGNSEILAENEHDEEKKKIVHTIELSGRNQLALVNDILDMSKIESGKITIEEAPYDLSSLLHDLKLMLSVHAKDAGVPLVIEQLNQEKYLLVGDVHRIGQVLINIIGNALKFTEKGEVKLTTRVDNNNLIFQIKDSGIGMSPEAIDNLFQCFEQADGTISRRFGGSGLGLYISEKLTDLMGGWIDASSKEGEGSLFQVVLPYRISDVPVVKHEKSAVKESALNEKLVGQVLVAEDTPELQLLERRILEGIGLVVTVANNGREAVDLAQEHKFDLILMDMQMPEVDGIEATKILRSRGNTVPIVALTANVMQKHRDQFHEAGCNGFLAKPIDTKLLRQTISPYMMLETDEKYLEEKGLSDNRQTNRRISSDRRVEEHERRDVIPRRLQSRVDEAVSQQSSIAEEFVDDELMEIFRVSAASNRRLLADALSNKDWKKIKEVAHPIKGSGASFGFPVLTEKAKAVCDAYDNDALAGLSELTQNLIDELDSSLS